MHIAIIGIGALGCLFGSALSRAGTVHRVTLYGHWREQAETLARSGLRVSDRHGNSWQVPLTVATAIEDVEPAHVALIVVKSHQTEKAAQAAEKILKPDGFAVTLQNGLGNFEKLAARLGPERAALGVTAAGASLDGPGQLRQSSTGPTYLATHAGHPSRIDALARIFAASGLETHISANAQAMLWQKLAANAGINPLTAIFGVKNGELLHDPVKTYLLEEAAREVDRLANTVGIKLEAPDAAVYARNVCERTAGNWSSMYQDIRNGRPTEIESINGEVVRRADQVGIVTPVNGELLRMVREIGSGHSVDHGKLMGLAGSVLADPSDKGSTE